MKHPIQRARERYGLILTGADIHVMQGMIRAGHRNVLIVSRQHNGSIIVILWGGKHLRAVASKEGDIMTFLPIEATQIRSTPKPPARKRRNSAAPSRDCHSGKGDRKAHKLRRTLADGAWE